MILSRLGSRGAIISVVRTSTTGRSSLVVGALDPDRRSLRSRFARRARCRGRHGQEPLDLGLLKAARRLEEPLDSLEVRLGEVEQQLHPGTCDRIGEQWMESLDDTDGIAVWSGGDYFPRIFLDYRASGAAAIGAVGRCAAELLDARDFVRFAVRWMNEYLTDHEYARSTGSR